MCPYIYASVCIHTDVYMDVCVHIYTHTHRHREISEGLTNKPDLLGGNISWWREQ